MATLDPKGPEARSIRGAEISMVFQEPMTSLSPVHTIGNQIMEAILLHQEVDKEGARRLAIDMLDRVGMPHPGRTIDRYPHQLSGGMRQRAMIAMALSCQPSILIADEPTTALDVTTQAQILSLMKELQDDLGMAIIFITHDLGVIAQMADHVVVMLPGRSRRDGRCADALLRSQTPVYAFFVALDSSVRAQVCAACDKPVDGDPRHSARSLFDPGWLPLPPRCHNMIRGVCDQQDPPFLELEAGHKVRCVLYE
jgi:peptide/nickel transport system ATP-binding protein